MRLRRRLAADPEVVFAAWTVPDRMRRWMFVSDQGEIVDVSADPEVGGEFSILERIDDAEIDHFGRYLVVEPPVRLSFTLEVPKHFSESTRIDLTLEREPRGCLIDFTQTGIDPDKTRRFWEAMLSALAHVVSPGSDDGPVG